VAVAHGVAAEVARKPGAAKVNGKSVKVRLLEG
jgi:hypothetical protein